jgi:hypothetical protein
MLSALTTSAAARPREYGYGCGARMAREVPAISCAYKHAGHGIGIGEYYRSVTTEPVPDRYFENLTPDARRRRHLQLQRVT